MPTIIPIKDLRNTNEISELAHQTHGPIYITKNGYSDLVIMSNEYYESMSDTARIDAAIYKAEKEYEETGITYTVDEVFDRLENKYFGKKISD